MLFLKELIGRGRIFWPNITKLQLFIISESFILKMFNKVNNYVANILPDSADHLKPADFTETLFLLHLYLGPSLMDQASLC